ALAAALPELDFACGLGTLSLLAGDVVNSTASLRPVQGYLPVPGRPPAPDTTLLDTYTVTAPQHQQWWRARLARARAALPEAYPSEGWVLPGYARTRRATP
ncbi:MAG: hypothetical protein JO287_19840, partial [Pseudonocardiales bacterium]|nr:hypothetical protein [Pseudonocardiales bacterium]